MEHKHPHCDSEHETILYELEKLQEELDEERRENKRNTVARIKTETIVDIIRMVGVVNIIGLIGGGLFYLFK